MMKSSRALLALACLGAAHVHLQADTIELPRYGFEIEAMDAETTGNPAQALIMFLPASEGFAPNVNVQIQPYPGTLASYVELSQKQFEQVKFEVIAQKVDADTEWRVEYRSPSPNGPLRHYARAVVAPGQVYLVTATAKDSQWTAVEAILRRHVDSFRLK